VYEAGSDMAVLGRCAVCTVCIACIGPLSGLGLAVDRVALDTHRAKEPCPHAVQNATIARTPAR
jgi:hypothetical protein